MISIVDVGPRDGLQNESVLLSTADKVELIEALARSGVRRIEAVSFVDPKRVPQMADAEDVMAGLSMITRAKAIGLVLNPRGFDRAARAGVREINYVVVASESFARANQNSTIEALVEGWYEISTRASAAGMKASVTVSAAFGCPFEGEVPQSRVEAIVEKLMELEPAELAIGDTIGSASPEEVRRLVRSLRRTVGDRVPLRLHFHNTRNAGLANAWVAVEEGVNALDASVGGVGGCPFAPQATGNIPTEDLVWMLERSGISTGINLEKLLEASALLESKLGKSLPSLVSKAGVFPPSR